MARDSPEPTGVFFLSCFKPYRSKFCNHRSIEGLTFDFEKFVTPYEATAPHFKAVTDLQAALAGFPK